LNQVLDPAALDVPLVEPQRLGVQFKDPKALPVVDS